MIIIIIKRSSSYFSHSIMHYSPSQNKNLGEIRVFQTHPDFCALLSMLLIVCFFIFFNNTHYWRKDHFLLKYQIPITHFDPSFSQSRIIDKKCSRQCFKISLQDLWASKFQQKRMDTAYIYYRELCYFSKPIDGDTVKYNLIEPFKKSRHCR